MCAERALAGWDVPLIDGWLLLGRMGHLPYLPVRRFNRGWNDTMELTKHSLVATGNGASISSLGLF